MKANDPKITAFVLGELSADEAAEVRAAAVANADVAMAVEQARTTAQTLSQLLGSETLALRPDQRAAILNHGKVVSVNQAASPFRRRKLMAMGAAAAVAVSMAALWLNQHSANQGQIADVDRSETQEIAWANISLVDMSSPVVYQRQSAEAEQDLSKWVASSVAEKIAAEPAAYQNKLEKVAAAKGGNFDGVAVSRSDSEEIDWMIPELGVPFMVPMFNGKASWLEAELALQRGVLPSAELRVDELINAFDYQQQNEILLGGYHGSLELLESPWNPGCLLAAVHVSVADQWIEGVNVALQVDDAKVAGLRVIGYVAGESGKMIPSADFASASNQSSYVLYELKPHEGVELDGDSVQLQLIFDQNTVATATQEIAQSLSSASNDLQFAATLVTFCESLQSSNADSKISLLVMLDQAEKRNSENAQRCQFIQQVRSALSAKAE